MAADFFTIAGVYNIATEGQQALNALTGVTELDTKNLVQQAMGDISAKIEQLQSAESDFLDFFGCKSIEEFKRKVREYYNSHNLVNYTGTSLQKYTKEYSALSDSYKTQLSVDMDTILYNLFQQQVANNGPLVQDLQAVFQQKPIEKAAAQAIANLIIQELSSFGLGVLDSTGFMTLTADITTKSKSGNDFLYLFNMCAAETTKVFKRDLSNLKQIAQGKMKTIKGVEKKKDGTRTIKQVDANLVNKAKNLIQGSVQNVQITNNSLNQTFVIDWSSLIREATIDNSGRASQIKEDADLQKINSNITDMIVKDFHMDGIFENYAREKITNMWKNEPDMFFIGSASTKLTGVLGEINTMIALSNLLGSRFNSEIIHWVGSQTTGGKQPSVDVALTEIGKYSFGIQTKNTTQDLTDVSHYINFADKSVDSILESLGISEGGESIKNVYISDVFNVPYKRKGKKYVKVGYNTQFIHNDPTAALFHLYTIVDEMIDNIVNQINLYMSRFAADFLYMGFENNGSGFRSALAALDNEVLSLSGNFVYIVGAEVTFASEILIELREQLKALQELDKMNEQTNFKIEAYFGELKSDSHSHFTIVEHMNGNGHLSEHTIKLRSAWGFHK